MKDTSIKIKTEDGRTLTIVSKQGDQGIQGEKGDAGPQGIDGPQGVEGVPGKDGINGKQGPKGDKGDTGAQGPKGDIGPEGKQGSADTALQIAEKINTLDKNIDWKTIKNIPFDVLNPSKKTGGGGSSTFAQLNDVFLSGLSNGQVPVYNSTTGKWENGTPSSGGVTSVTAADSTLTISPTTGDVLAGLNLANANTWTGTQTVRKNGLGTTTADAIVLENTTSATSGNQQVSPALHSSGRYYDTDVSTSRPVDFRQYLLPIQGSGSAQSVGEYLWQSSVNGGSWSTILSLSRLGSLKTTVTSGAGVTGYEISAPFSNSTPGTTQHIKLSNTGSYSWITGYFTGTLKNAFGFASDGTVSYMSQNGYHNFYSGTISPTLLGQIYGGGFYTGGGGFHGGRVTAGGAYTTPPATFTNYGSTGLKTVTIDTPTTLTDAYTSVRVDCSSYNECTGTPSVTDCTTYTGSGQATCESHYGCTWYAGDSCSAFDGDISTCGATSGCTVVTSGCSGFDETTCLANDDAYGGTCAWSEGFASCSVFDSSEASCTATTGCTAVYGDCSPYSDGGGDGSACYAYNPGCSYDSGSGACTGTPYLNSCTGSYSTGFSCSGNYNTGACSGTYNILCSGTASCSGYGDSSACTGEAGCSWTSGVSITMPANPEERLYLIGKKNTSGLLTILPNTGQTINYTTSITSSSTAGVGWVLGWVEADSNWHVYAKN